MSAAPNLFFLVLLFPKRDEVTLLVADDISLGPRVQAVVTEEGFDSKYWEFALPALMKQYFKLEEFSLDWELIGYESRILLATASLLYKRVLTLLLER